MWPDSRYDRQIPDGPLPGKQRGEAASRCCIVLLSVRRLWQVQCLLDSHGDTCRNHGALFFLAKVQPFDGQLMQQHEQQGLKKKKTFFF